MDRRTGLPQTIKLCLFDLDGVLTRTASVHSRAWKEMFDQYLHSRVERTGEPFVPFDRDREYRRYVDGKSRTQGIRDFVSSRGIHLPQGAADDPPTAQTVQGLARRKNDILLRLLAEQGVQVFASSVDYVRAVRSVGLRTAVVSSSANANAVLEAAGLVDLFDARVDAQVAERRQLRGKPAPDTFLEAARVLGGTPAEGAVFEDAVAGVAAGRAGDFGYVVGVDRDGRADALRAAGADIVVDDLARLRERG